MHASTDPVFVAFWCAGPDPDHDDVRFLEAVAFPEDGPVVLVEPTDLSPGPQPVPPGPDAGRSAGLAALLRPLSARPVLLAEGREAFLRRFRRVLPGVVEPVVADLEALARYWHPGRGERSYAGLHQRFLGRSGSVQPRATELRALLEAMVAAHFERSARLRHLFARASDELLAHGGEELPEAREWLELAHRLLDRPSRFAADPESGLFRSPLADGRHEEDLEEAPLEPERCLAELEPRFSTEYRERFADQEPLEGSLDEPAGLDDDDMRRMEAYFDLLPRHFAEAEGIPTPSPERPGQRGLGHAVERCLAGGGFLIGDAPTGTGKTVAYLAPLLLWSTAHNVRLAVSTYTRALQEQAFFREIPRALELLRQAGLPEDRTPRVSLLKGRANYICGRAIADIAPETGDGSAVRRATWLRLALYYCEDAFGDLDGFPVDPGVPLGNEVRTARRALETVHTVRAVPGCCEGSALFRCAAGVRTLRAERSHVVVTNHAYILARPEAFRHVLFDECDHLHEVTISARSFDIPLDEVAGLSTRLVRGRGRDPAPLQRLSRLLSRLAPGDVGERLRDAAVDAGSGARQLDAAALLAGRELRAYDRYRREVGDGLSREERAFLLHDYLTTGRGDALLTALRELLAAVDRTDGALRTVIEELGNVPYRNASRLRWSLRRPLDALAHWREGLEIWLGGEQGEADFSEDLHFQAVFEGHKLPFLSLKWLLPHQWLGETYYPALGSAVLVSATARLRNGFKAMKGYLGLDILEEDRQDRGGRPVAEFAGPPTFAPDAALVCIPQDAPAYSPRGPGLEVWTQYLEDFLVFLAERTGGRVLGLFTNRFVLQRVAERLRPAFAARGIPLYWQNMPGLLKEDIVERFRNRVDSVLLGLDTFWYGVDFPGDTCQHVVVTKLPFGVLDDYHYAQRARMGEGPHRTRVYMPRALAMFRQGCGRLLRNERDRGVVYVLDRRVLERRHANFLAELPRGPDEFDEPVQLAADSDTCLSKAFAHMKLTAGISRRGLDGDFSKLRGALQAGPAAQGYD